MTLFLSGEGLSEGTDAVAMLRGSQLLLIKCSPVPRIILGAWIYINMETEEPLGSPGSLRSELLQHCLGHTPSSFSLTGHQKPWGNYLLGKAIQPSPSHWSHIQHRYPVPPWLTCSVKHPSFVSVPCPYTCCLLQSHETTHI